MSSTQKNAKLARTAHASAKSAETKPGIKVNAIEFSVLQADVLKSLTSIEANDKSTGNLNQRIAWDILRYRDTETKPVAFDRMKADGKALTTWRANIRTLFIGKAPTMKGEKTGSMHVARKLYAARARVMDDACGFVVAAGLRGVTSDMFSETLGCFKVPAVVLVPSGYQAQFDLREMHDENKMVALDNSVYTLSGKNKEGKTTFVDIRASIRQVLSVFRAKPVTPVQTTEQIAAQAALKGANDKAQIDPVVIKTVLKNAGIEQLARALNTAMNADPKIALAKDQFEASDWNCLMSIAQRIMTMANTADMKRQNEVKSGDKVAA